MTAGKETLRLPAIRAHMGDWIYYVTFMTMKEVAERVSIAEHIHTSDSLRELLQRQLTKRSEGITRYLLSQEQRFFNALVVASYGGAPQWQEIAIRERRIDMDEGDSSHLEGLLGVLILDGSEELFALDGQHRVAGIRAAIASRPDLGTEEVSVLLVRGITQQRRAEDEPGFQRTRRLFTTLNRYAKPVSKRDIIALDEDDVVALITRDLVDDYRLFVGKVSSKTVNSIHRNDSTSFTTITAIYDSLDFFLKDRGDWKRRYKRFRPPDEEVEAYSRRATDLWENLRRNFDVVQEMYDSEPGDEAPGKYRNLEGGHLLFRPVGLLMVVKAIRRLMDQGASLRRATERIAALPMVLADEPWHGLLWDEVNQRMSISGETKRTTERLLVYLASGSLAPLKTTAVDLKDDIAGLRNEPAYRLPRRRR